MAVLRTQVVLSPVPAARRVREQLNRNRLPAVNFSGLHADEREGGLPIDDQFVAQLNGALRVLERPVDKV